MTERGRLWASIVYEDSENTPKDWLQVVDDLLIPCYVVKHDKDEGKTHYHVFFVFDGVKSRKQILRVVKTFGGVGCEYIHDKRAYTLYLTHQKSEGKYKYPIDSVKALNGITDYQEAIEGISKDKYELMDEMLDWCGNNTVCFAELVDYARKERTDWLRCLISSGTSNFIMNYLKSVNWMKQCQLSQIRERERV